MIASAGPWVNGIWRDDALATQRSYHLSHFTGEETEAWRNSINITGDGIFSRVCAHQGGGSLGRQEGFTSVL